MKILKIYPLNVINQITRMTIFIINKQQYLKTNMLMLRNIKILSKNLTRKIIYKDI